MDRTTLFTVSHQSSAEERALILNQIYRRILERQPFEFERLAFKKVEEDFLKGKIGVRRFIRLLGASSLYLNEFYYKCAPLKFVEICFQQLMGRAPHSFEEIQNYGNILARQGPAKLVSALLDTEEYRKTFGCFTVPYFRAKTVYPTPYAYLETRTLLHEAVGQRNWSVPLLVARQLAQQNDQAAQFSLDELSTRSDFETEAPSLDVSAMQKQLKEILMTLDRSAAKQVVEKLPTAQRRRLQAILR